jgi:electron transfer flavoprotein alpha/beta subunit
MRIAACIRPVVDPEARYRLRDDKSVDFGGAPRLMDPAAAAAIEVGAIIADQHQSSITLYSVAGEEADDVLRTGLAQGGQNAVRVTGVVPSDGLDAATALADAISAGEPPDLVLCGTTSSDGGGGSTGAALAAQLKLPIVQNVLSVDSVSETEATVQRRRDGGYREVVRVQLPAVLTVEQIAARPRFPTTRERLRAQKATIETRAGVLDADAETEELDYQVPPPKLMGILWPGPELNARERIRFLVQGGQSHESNGDGPITGDPSDVAGAIADYLREHGFVAQPANSKE